MNKVEEMRRDIDDVEAQFKEYQKNKLDALPIVMVAFHAKLAQLYAMLDAEISRQEHIYYSCDGTEKKKK